MARHKLQQVQLVSADGKTQRPFPGGWVLAIFEAVNGFASDCAAKHRLATSPRTHVRLKGGQPVKQSTYDEIESKLVGLTTALFPNVSAVNGFAKKYVDEYFRLWKQAADWSPQLAKCLSFSPGSPSVLGRALVRDLMLRLCYLESCERKLGRMEFEEAELEFLQHDSPAQVYQALISDRARTEKLSQEELAEQLEANDRNLRSIKSGKRLPSVELLLALKRSGAGHRLLTGVGFVDHLLKALGFGEGGLRNEFIAIASVIFRHLPPAMNNFKGRVYGKTASGAVRSKLHNFEGFVGFGDHLLVHPGFNELYPEMPDALWRAHLHTLQYARFADLAKAYFQFARVDDDPDLTRFLDRAELNSDGCPDGWMAEL